MSLETCYARIIEQVRINDVVVDITKWNVVQAGMVTDYIYTFDFVQAMPEGWTPSEGDILLYDAPGTEDLSEVPGYTAQTVRKLNSEGIFYNETKYFYGLIGRTSETSFRIIGSDEYMPEGWSPIAGTHKILWEDVYETYE